MPINHMTITKITCSPNAIYDAADLLRYFATDLEENSKAIFTTFGKVISGKDSGDLLFLSMFDGMADVENSFSRMEESEHWSKIYKLKGTNTPSTDIFSFLETDFVELALKQPFYINLTYGYLDGVTEEEFLGSVNRVTGAFSESGALTMRLAKCLIGRYLESFLFGITYHSLEDFHSSACAMAQDEHFEQFSKHFNRKGSSLLKFLG